MRNKLLLSLLATLMVSSLVACGSTNTSTNTTTNNDNETVEVSANIEEKEEETSDIEEAHGEFDYFGWRDMVDKLPDEEKGRVLTKEDIDKYITPAEGEENEYTIKEEYVGKLHIDEIVDMWGYPVVSSWLQYPISEDYLKEINLSEECTKPRGMFEFTIDKDGYIKEVQIEIVQSRN